MAKIIPLGKDKDYLEHIQDTLNKLQEMEEDIITAAINTASKDKWKEWNKQFVAGDEFFFTDEMLKECEDQNVKDLAALADEIRETKREIAKRFPNLEVE